MRFKPRILLVLLAIVLVIAAAPLLVPPGVRVWIWWTARQENLIVKIDKIDTPFLRPVVLHGLKITSPPEAAARIQLNAAQTTIHLNLRSILLRTSDRALSQLVVSRLRVQIHRNDSGNGFPAGTWRTWQKLLPKACTIDDFDLRVEDGAMVALLRGGSLSFSEIEAGKVSIDELTIASPVVRQTFSQLHGATHWQSDRLIFAGLALTRGLDLQTIAFDLSHLGRQRLGVELDVDAFGGKIRGNISTDWHTPHSHWNIAASASDLSLGQTGEAIGLADRVAGLLHAGKFTFRGDPHDPMRATASLWTELTAPAWRERQADVVMLGAALSNRQIALQQLYVRQGKNELTLSGEAPLPEKLSDWLKADYRADISASINNVGSFARLLGGKPEEFAGQIAIDGAISSRSHKLGGRISAAGRKLRLFNSPVDLFAMKLNLAPNEAEIGEFNLQRGKDFLRVEGKIDMSHEKGLQGTVAFSAANVADYFPNALPAGPLNGRFDFNGRTAVFDPLQLGSISFSGTANFAELQKIVLTFQPLSPIFEIVPATGGDCIDRLQISALPGAPSLPIDKLELDAALPGGIRSISLTTNAGETKYRISCSEGNNRPLEIGVPKK